MGALLDLRPGGAAVFHGRHLGAAARQRVKREPPADRIVVCDENLHEWSSTRETEQRTCRAFEDPGARFLQCSGARSESPVRRAHALVSLPHTVTHRDHQDEMWCASLHLSSERQRTTGAACRAWCEARAPRSARAESR